MGNDSKICETCRHRDNSAHKKPCSECLVSGFINWQPSKAVANLINEAERKAFEAARELHPTKFAERKYETFEAWKEAGK